MTTANDAYAQALAAHQRGQLDEALTGYQAVIRRQPEHADALHMLGVGYMQTGKLDEAVTLIRRSLRVRPADARVHSNLASALLASSRFDEAIEAARRATELDATLVVGWANLGTALMRRNRYREAMEPLRRAVALQPQRPGLHSALGSALGAVRQFDEAIESHRKAIALAPDRPQYRNNMALTLRRAGLNAEAEAMLRAIVEEGNTDPDYFVQLAGLLKKQGKIADAVGVLKQIDAPEAQAVVGQGLQFLQNYTDTLSVAEQFEEARQAARRKTESVVRMPPAATDRDPYKRLKVGFVSSDLRRHAVALFLLGVVRKLDAAKLELYGYSGANNGDDVNAAFREAMPNWRATESLTDEELAARIRADGIDVLLDMSGPTSGGRLGVFARKPAPVSSIWLGYSGTSGHEAIDYILGDTEVLPDGVTQSVEAPWRLPDAYLCFQPTQASPPVAALPAVANGYVTFGSLNNINKISDATLDCWADVLAGVPDSRMVLKGKEDMDEAASNVVNGLVRRGVAAERIEMLPWVPGWCEHLPLYNRIDIGLDPFPYNGTTTTCEALLMGVPTVTMRGDRFIARVGATINRTVGLDDWIAGDVAGYVALAAEKARDIDKLATMRAGLRQQLLSSPLGDTERFARNFEAALRGMWRAYCAA